LPHIVDSGAPADAGKVLETERQMFALRDGDNQNPYSWDFDLCSLTLGNFNYRKMTLVRDYAKLIETDMASGAFDRVFSSPRSHPRRHKLQPLNSPISIWSFPATPRSARQLRGRARERATSSKALRHRQIPDHHEPHRGLRRAREASLVRLREARGHRRRVPPPAPAGVG